MYRYDLVLVVEQFFESMVALKHMLNASYKDMVHLKSKVRAGGMVWGPLKIQGTRRRYGMAPGACHRWQPLNRVGGHLISRIQQNVKRQARIRQQ